LANRFITQGQLALAEIVHPMFASHFDRALVIQQIVGQFWNGDAQRLSPVVEQRLDLRVGLRR